MVAEDVDVEVAQKNRPSSHVYLVNNAPNLFLLANQSCKENVGFYDCILWMELLMMSCEWGGLF